MKDLWDHQRFALDEIEKARREKINRILLTSPTGGGKTRVMLEVAKWGYPTSFYTDKRILLEQLGDVLHEAEIEFGVRAAGIEPDFEKRVQLSMIQTDAKRCFAGTEWDLHRATIAFVDEAHDVKAEQGQAIIDRHVERGETVIGMTATPLDLGGLYQRLIVAGTNSELRACGALVPAITYAPNEPEAPRLKAIDGIYSEKAIGRALSKSIFYGNIIEHWRKLNPLGRATVGFAHSVEASLGHAQEFQRAGIAAAHIDGDDTWIAGTWYRSDRAARDELREASRSGRIKVVWCRYVLREGVDWPWIAHTILATIFGSLVGYLQAVGRSLRAYPGLTSVVVQDHGGNYWRHGSANIDRYWELGSTRRVEFARRKHRLRNRDDPSPIVCPKCFAVRTFGRECPECGHVTRRIARLVVQSDGKLREVVGEIYAPKRYAAEKPLSLMRWERCYWQGYHSPTRKTFSEMIGWFARQYYAWPREHWPRMPKHETDLFRSVRDVDHSRLY